MNPYLSFYLAAKTSYHFHSPSLFRLIRYGLSTEDQYYSFGDIDTYYKALCCLSDRIPFTDFSGSKNQSGRTLAEFAKKAVAPPRHAKRLFKLINFFQPRHILELGSCLGMSAAAMAWAKPTACLLGVEGNPFLADHANKLLAQHQISNAWIKSSLFTDFFQEQDCSQFDLVYLDGDHHYDSTMQYIKILLTQLPSHAVILMDDIHWSHEMYSAWNEIKKLPRVNASLETIRLGILFLDGHQIKGHHSWIPYYLKPWQIGLFSSL
ncbi:MAG TPA: class I SAM-dependent methyltransferase [Saprospiraceae bacterium]|nr:class I SAM-dependent methyltransferase [Saprospiraceae bacterium]